jgi:hypothetical protein
MSAMNLYLAQARLCEVRQTHAATGALSMPFVIEEILQVLKGAVLPMNHNRAACGDHLSDHLGDNMGLC